MPKNEESLDRLDSLLGGELREALSARPAGPIPEQSDHAIRAEIARRSAAIRSRRAFWPVWVRAVAAAALVAAGAWALAGRWGQVTPLSAADLDGSGRVDIVDAYLLARRIESGDEPSAELDFNADGRVDRLDVDALAGRAVSVSGGA